MRIAVCVSGVPRSGVGDKQQVNRDYKRNFKNLQKNFPTADFFIGTWDKYEAEAKKDFAGAGYWTFPEPEAHYHPYLDIPKDIMISDYMRKFSDIYRSKPHLHERTKHQAKQILCHANMVDSLPEKYDIIIRTRFDTFTYTHADFSGYINDVYNNKTAIGFACLKPQFAGFNIPVEVDKNNAEHYNTVSEYLFDQLIIHHADCIDTKYIFKLFQEKRLCPAEFGWYQVLSLPYGSNHRCISGWANPDRAVLKNWLGESK